MPLDPHQLPEIARRAAARALSGQGAADPEIRGAVQVDVGRGERPVASAEERRRSGGNALVRSSCIRKAPEGSQFRVPHGATITPLARELAFERGITFVSGHAPVQGSAEGGALRVAVGSDHGGFALKTAVIEWLAELGHRALDLGTKDTAACDYPDFASAVARAVAEGQADLGVVVDGAGIGSAMAANKVPGVLAANAWCEAAARNAREHNHANVLTLGAGLIDAPTAQAVLRAFLSTRVGPGRHERRVNLIRDIEARYSRSDQIARGEL